MHRDGTTAFFVALNAESGVPGEIMLLPKGPLVRTVDGRGPYRLPDPQRLVADSLAAAPGGLLAIDENHSIDLAGPKGEPSPARGWMTGLQARADGIYASVDWTEPGKALLAERAYRGVSVVFNHTADGTITRIKRASLVNNPNLRDVVALQAEGVDMLKAILEALGLKDDADEATVIKAIKELKGSTAMQAALTPIAKAAGLKDDADAVAIASAVTVLATEAKAGAKGDAAAAITALQAELSTVTTRLNTLTASAATERATAFVDGAIKAGRVGVKPLRDHYVAMHAENPARVEKEINALPALGASGASIVPPKPDKDGKVALNAEQSNVAKLLGLKPEDYAKTLAAEQAANEEAA